MLKVDLGQLERKGRIRIDETVPASDPILDGLGADLPAGLEVRLEGQFVGHDILVRGRLAGDVRVECRRCLREVRDRVEEDVTWLFRPGLTEAEAEEADAYAVPARSREIDLAAAVREHVILGLPGFPVCAEVCRGLCPQCGANLNEGPCACHPAAADPRWSALRQSME